MFSGLGKLISFTHVINPPQRFESMAPYCIGIIELEEGVKILSQLTDITLGEISIGMPVKAVFRKIIDNGDSDIISYGIKFIKT